MIDCFISNKYSEGSINPKKTEDWFHIIVEENKECYSYFIYFKKTKIMKLRENKVKEISALKWYSETSLSNLASKMTEFFNGLLMIKSKK